MGPTTNYYQPQPGEVIAVDLAASTDSETRCVVVVGSGVIYAADAYGLRFTVATTALYVPAIATNPADVAADLEEKADKPADWRQPHPVRSYGPAIFQRDAFNPTAALNLRKPKPPQEPSSYG